MVAPENDLDHGRLYKIHPNGEGRTLLSSSCTGTCQGDGFPNWSRSGELIAFQRFVSADPSQEVGVFAIFVMRTDGTGVRQITLRSADPSQFKSLHRPSPELGTGRITSRVRALQ